MKNNGKSDAEINSIISELRELELYDREEYEKKIKLLKKNNPDIYFKAMILLNLNKDENYSSNNISQKIPAFAKKPEPIIPLPSLNAAPKPKNANPPAAKPIKKIMQKKSNPAVLAILSMVILGILVLSAMGIFWITNPPTGDTSRNSLRLGYQIFNNLSSTYLNYTFSYNLTDLEFSEKQYYYGSQYYSLNNSRITAVLQNPNKDIISKEQNGYLYYDISSNYSKISTALLRINNTLIISLYDEAYNLVNNYYNNESGREGGQRGVWNLTDIPCAPIFFEIDISKAGFGDLSRLRYEMCLDNNGIPITIAKESVYNDSYEVIIAYLESISPEIRDLIFMNKSMGYWENLTIDDY
jgi:hypothetical protein